MKRWIIASWVLVAGCGTVKDPSRCGTSADCPAGEYCASAQGEQRCWPDANPPVVSGVAVSCLEAAAGEKCPRDGTVRITATASDAEELAEVRVALTLDPTATIAMTRAGQVWSADVPLATVPIAAFEATVDATVTARDGARHEASATSAAAIPVTRLRWTKEVEPGQAIALTPAAVMADGTVVVAGSNGKVYFVNPDGTRAHEPVTVGSGQAISAAPAIGTKAIWVGSEDASLRGLALDGSGALPGVVVNSEGAIRGSVAVFTEATKEWGFAASGSGRLAATSTGLDTARSGATSAYVVGPALDSAGRVFGVSSGANSTIREFLFDGAFTDQWVASSPVVGVNVSASVAIDRNGNVITGSQDKKVNLTTALGQTATIATVDDAVIDSPIILPNGDIIVGDQSGALHRLAADGTPLWTPAKSLGAAVLSPMLLAGTPAPLLVPTRTGTLFALDGNGVELWHHALGTGAELRSGNLHTRPGQPAGHVLSTAYYPTSDGKLHAVIVDGELDTSAPWPKAFHDARNTSNAGTAP